MFQENSIETCILSRVKQKTIALTIWTFAGKVMAQLFNTLSRFFIAFLPRIIYIRCKVQTDLKDS